MGFLEDICLLFGAKALCFLKVEKGERGFYISVNIDAL